jgi:hypothetical protein
VAQKYATKSSHCSGKNGSLENWFTRKSSFDEGAAMARKILEEAYKTTHQVGDNWG